MKAGKIWGHDRANPKRCFRISGLNLKVTSVPNMNTNLNGTDSLFNPGKMIVRVWQEDQEGLVDETLKQVITQVKPGKVRPI